MTGKMAVIVTLATGLSLAVVEDPAEGEWKRNGVRVRLHFYLREPAGLTLTTQVFPRDLVEQKAISASLLTLGIVPRVQTPST